VARKPTAPVKLQLRLQEGMRWRLERAAARNNRSMNTEIIHRLQESLARDWEPKKIDPVTSQILTINEKLDRLIAILAREEERLIATPAREE
jgi:hypothetical protein